MKERSRYFTAPNPRQPHRGTRGLRGAIPDSHAFSSDFVFGIVNEARYIKGLSSSENSRTIVFRPHDWIVKNGNVFVIGRQ